ncbi:hypothetical protein PIROE2DRAFT_4962 [Piromyces sp. E2]|nr:hypothetical protein PIROE2DRAFT_4962 [Piromyces sp. E2]|eukprot:OUM67556.1 hypothetical protein PIROE2DRAFT_4962 [Piromyces sp. E2]
MLNKELKLSTEEINTPTEWINNWKQPIIHILLFHYIFRAVGDSLRAFSYAYPVKKFSSAVWPYSQARFCIGSVAALIFWMIGEIIGDW